MEPESNTSSTTTPSKLVTDPQKLDEVHELNYDQEEDSELRAHKILKFSKMMKKELKEKLRSHTNKDKPIADPQRVRKWISTKWIPGKALFKWMIIVLNVIIELCQAILTQEAGEGLITVVNYSKLCVIFSSICLTMSIFDIVLEAKEGGVKWRRRGLFYCLYYPGKHGRVFGSFWLVFGLISSMVQFILNLGSFVISKAGLARFNYLPLLLSVGFFFSAFGHGRKSMWAVVKCDNKHGEYEIEGSFVHGSYVFECPRCKRKGIV